MNLKIIFPSGISSLRIVLSPILFFSIINDMRVWAICISVFALFTDLLDGYFARKFNLSSNFGAYLDTAADFILILTAFSAFIIAGLYPLWILVLISLMFLQFIITSSNKPVYDPLGKYYGSFLFVSAGVTLLLPLNLICSILLIIIVLFTLISMLTRFYFLFNNKNLLK